MTREQLCNLRGKLIMDEHYSQEEQTIMYGLLDREIHRIPSDPDFCKD